MSNIVFMDSFSHYGGNSIPAKYGSPQSMTGVVTPNASIVFGEGRGGNACLRFAADPSPSRLSRYFPYPNATTTIAAEAAVRFAALPPNGDIDKHVLMRFAEPWGNTAQPHIQLTITNLGNLRVSRGVSSQLGITSGLGLQPNTWYHLGLYANVTSDFASGWWELALNGMVILSGQAVTAAAGVVPQVSQVDLGAVGTVQTDWSDFVISNGFRNGDCAVRALLADANGVYSQWTPVNQSTGLDCVDDTAMNSDTDYISSQLQNQKSSFGCKPVPLDGPVLAVQHVAAMRKDDTSTGRICTQFIRHNGVDYESAQFSLNDAWTFHTHVLSTNPADGSTWTKAQVDVLEAGVRSI